eukprot:6895450-Alexandrium_andersonii.AAC.1
MLPFPLSRALARPTSGSREGVLHRAALGRPSEASGMLLQWRYLLPTSRRPGLGVRGPGQVGGLGEVGRR